MKKLLFLLSLLFLQLYASGQTPIPGVLASQWYLTGAENIGKGERYSIADTAAWLDIGKDTTTKGIIFPKVIISTFANPNNKRALFAYNLIDSGLYKIDGTVKVRFLTMQDTALIRYMIANGDVLTFDGHNAAYYLNRANHTGAQAISTITGLQTALDLKPNWADTVGGGGNDQLASRNYVLTHGGGTTYYPGYAIRFSNDSIIVDTSKIPSRFKYVSDSTVFAVAIASKLSISDTVNFVRKPFTLNVNGAEGDFTASRLDLTVGYVAYSGHADNADVALYSNATDSTKSKSVYQARLDSIALATLTNRTLQQVVISGNRDTTAGGIFLGNKTPLTGRMFSAAHTFTNPTGTIDDYLSFSVINATSAAYTGTMYGGLFAPEVGSLNTQNWTGGGIKGLRLNVHANSAATGTLAYGIGLEVGGDNFNKVNVTEYHGADFHHPVSSTGVITNAGGIFINTMQTYATNTAMLVMNQLFTPSGNWGIYNTSALPNKLGTGISETGRLVIDTANSGSRSDSVLTLNATTRQTEMITFPVTTTQLNNKVDSVYRKPATDSVFFVKNGVSTFAFIDSVGTGGGSVNWGSIGGTLSSQTDLNSALAGKEPTITATTSADYYRGDKTFQPLNKAAVALGNVENTALSTWAGTSNITTVGTIGTGTWSATAIDATHGGTGQTSWALGDLMYASATNVLSKLSGNTTTTKKFLSQTGNGSVSAAPGWNTLVAGDIPDISATYSPVAGSASIATVGTVTSGTWQGSVLSSTYGGTGVNNGGRTLTLNTNSGTFAFSNASKTVTFGNTLTFNGTDATTLTFPSTNATIARTDAAQTFTGVQTFSSPPVISTITNTGTQTIPTVTGTLVQYVLTTTASSATPTPTGDARDNRMTITALATAPTFAAPSGTATDGNTLLIRIKDNATARALTWNAIYRAGTVLALPTTTTISKTMYVQFVYNSADTKWDLIGFTNGI